MFKFFISLIALIALASCSQITKQITSQYCGSFGCEKHSPSPSETVSAYPPEIDISPDIIALVALAQTKPKAAHDLALKFFRGEGIAQDPDTSLKWMRHSGELGQLEAQKALGLFYLTGLGNMGANPTEAEKWLKIAASRGDSESAALVLEANRAKQQEWKNEQYWRKNAHRQWLNEYTYFGEWRDNRWWY